MGESVISLFDTTTAQFEERPAIQFFSPQQKQWQIKSWRELAVQVNKLANALVQLGAQAHDRVGIISATRLEWIIADLAILKASLVSVPIYHSSLSDQVGYIVADAMVKIIFVENLVQLEKVRKTQRSDLTPTKIIIFDAILGPLEKNEIYFADFVANKSDKFESMPIKSSNVASIVYTSGTTGEPKGGMITHDNFYYQAQVIEKLGLISPKDIQLLFLPLAHIFARVLEIAWIKTGHLLGLAQSVDKVLDNMSIIRPTLMASVPRIFEKIRDKIIEQAELSSWPKRFLARKAFKYAQDKLDGKPKSFLQEFVTQKLVFDQIGSKLKNHFGGRLRFFVSGGAPLNTQVADFFARSNIIICEGYGLTETTALTCLNLPWAIKSGSVGKAVPGTEVCLSDEQEILVRGRGVFKGFWNKPLDSNKVFGENNWFKTGDIGQIDKDGFVKIIDRKRDIIVTSQGKNIAPARVEDIIKSKSPLIAHVVVVGEKLPYLTALIVLDPAAAGMKNFAKNSQVFQQVKQAIADANISLASFEQIKRFHILDCEFKIGEELTPTLKVKRKLCSQKFSKEIKSLYA